MVRTMHHHDCDDTACAQNEVGAVASRSLHLLDAIDETVTSLENNRQLVTLLSDHAKKQVAALKASPPAHEIDEDGKVSEKLDLAAQHLRRIYDDAIRRRKAAVEDADLHPDDGIVDAYTAFIAAAADFHNSLEDLRDVVETLDSLHSPTAEGGPYENVSDLLKALKA